MSLGLVAYEDSEESENESDSEDKPPLNGNQSQSNVVTPPPNENNCKNTKLASVRGAGQISDDEVDLTTSSVNDSAHISDEEVEPLKNSEKSMNLHIPESKLSLINTDIDIKCLTTTTRKAGPVKITIPSLNEVIDESEPPSKKKLKPSQKGSGLFALLPNPKSSLVPHSVSSKKPSTQSARKPAHTPSPAKKPIQPRQTASSLISYEDSGDEEETSETVDFFSLETKNKDVAPSVADVNIDIPQISPIINSGIDGSSSTSSWVATSDGQGTHSKSWMDTASQLQASGSHSAQTTDTQPDFGYSTSEFMSVSNSDLELDQQAMQQLCGRRDRMKIQEVNLIEVSGDAIMPDSREWLTKQLTEEVVHRPSHKRKDGPTTQQKRKHQITYLAYQAKENELELKNQWANNRMSRKQTQAKYGF